MAAHYSAGEDRVGGTVGNGEPSTRNCATMDIIAIATS